MTRIFSLNFHILTPKLKFAMEEISMKATGIVRRIDDLGRVVVPKEIRRTLRIREGDPMEIFTNHDGEIILKKYSPIGEIEMFAKQYADVMAQVSGQRVLISDRDQIIAVAGGVKKDKIGMAVSSQLEELMSNRDVKNGDEQQKLFEIIKGEEPEQYLLFLIILPLLRIAYVTICALFQSKGLYECCFTDREIRGK